MNKGALATVLVPMVYIILTGIGMLIWGNVVGIVSMIIFSILFILTICCEVYKLAKKYN